jgi:hypothetical protein
MTVAVLAADACATLEDGDAASSARAASGAKTRDLIGILLSVQFDGQDTGILNDLWTGVLVL